MGGGEVIEMVVGRIVYFVGVSESDNGAIVATSHCCSVVGFFV